MGYCNKIVYFQNLVKVKVIKDFDILSISLVLEECLLIRTVSVVAFMGKFSFLFSRILDRPGRNLSFKLEIRFIGS